MTSISLDSEALASIDVDAIVVGVSPAEAGPAPAAGSEDLDRALDGRLAEALAALGATGKAGEITKLPALGAVTAKVVVAAGLGEDPTAEDVRRAAGAAVRSLAGTSRVAVALPGTEADGTAENVEAVAIGALLGAYSFDSYRTGGEHKSPVEEIRLIAAADGAGAAVERARILAESVRLVRDLVNTPPSHLSPEDLAGEAERVAGETGLSVQILDEKALVDGGYGGIAGVGQGSVNPPRLVRLSYTHPEASKTLALVGKGITFDSGGLSLKPAEAMDWMKSDMGGAAAVLGALAGIARLGPKVNVVGYLAIAENMPSGTAQRPSDVLRIYGGKTVEVLNTDAEGRLVLADALVRAGEDSPDLIVDVATLTGAQLVALGTRTTGVMANDDAVREKVVAAAERAGEPSWGMPLPAELRKGLDSAVADIANISGERWGGMLVAGTFLKEFVPDGVKWAHLDIAGPAFNKGEPYGYTPKGGTGAAARTLVQIAEDVAAGIL
ncbi:leucyl aminopeptidase [Actinomadura livida]|uniref:Probable cytosol aminopeptidase n=1 Tax=Actinomadura livida TaxID=79909 RepID=A0A7W7IG79_9ACTN|nr:MULTISPECIES: leucyl aminopeptidase [Actinomadura]MBB4776537.1 leucyl aminopeptidase [Actinomadura catellatispora]GGT93014.1 putative cytosol aminopeptidase [Actinomadura livida]